LFDAVSGRQDELVEAMVRPELGELGESFPLDMNAVANDGTTLMIAAVEHGTFDTVCTAGADPRVHRGWETALSVAERKGMTTRSPAISSWRCEAPSACECLPPLWREPLRLCAVAARADLRAH
jgi:hypothetical protein